MSESTLELFRKSEVDMPKVRAEWFDATVEQRPRDRSRIDETYLNWDTTVKGVITMEFVPVFQRATTLEELQAASAAMESRFRAIYDKAHAFGGLMHINSPEEETSLHIRELAQHGWFGGSEQAIIVLFLHAGEKITEIYFDRIVTDRGRTLNRVELAVLSGQHPRTFTDPAVVEKLEMDAARDAEAAKHAPWESNFYTARNGRRLHLADVEGRRENDE